MARGERRGGGVGWGGVGWGGVGWGGVGWGGVGWGDNEGVGIVTVGKISPVTLDLIVILERFNVHVRQLQ